MFTPGTLITTDRGQRPVETLQRGDQVVTRDNGLRRINWVGRRVIEHADLQQPSCRQPVLVRRDSFARGAPARDMIVSLNHRFVVVHEQPDGAQEDALIAVRDLVDGKRIKWARMLGVSYIHLLCNAHEVVLADGVWTELFHPDDTVMRAMAEPQRHEILDLFPEIATMGAARRFPRRRPIRKSRFET